MPDETGRLPLRAGQGVKIGAIGSSFLKLTRNVIDPLPDSPMIFKELADEPITLCPGIVDAVRARHAGRGG
jgi:hypothetical protein